MLNQDFCLFLEYYLTNFFKHASDESLKNFWCDGVVLPSNENDYSEKLINKSRELLLTAFLGKDGQEKYSVLIRFGDKSLSRYTRGLDITECLPEFDKTHCYLVDKQLKQIIIQLY